jgi:hypothetical protein
MDTHRELLRHVRRPASRLPRWLLTFCAVSLACGEEAPAPRPPNVLVISIDNWRLSEDIPTMASLLHAAGYRTEAYTGGGNVRPELGFDVGFDTYETHGLS